MGDTFDTLRSGRPVSSHLIEVCSSSCCSGHVDGEQFFRNLCRLAGVDPEQGGASTDGLFRLQRSECLDVCDAGPILRLDGAETYKQISIDEAGKLLERLREGRGVSDTRPDRA